MNNNQVVVAFWKYDQFPYILSGVVSKFNDKGHVLIPSYGPLAYFTPIAVVERTEKIIEFMAKLKELKQSCRLLKDKIDREFKQKVADSLPFDYPEYIN